MRIKIGLLSPSVENSNVWQCSVYDSDAAVSFRPKPEDVLQKFSVEQENLTDLPTSQVLRLLASKSSILTKALDSMGRVPISINDTQVAVPYKVTEELVGSKIEKIFVSPKEDLMAIQTNRGTFAYRTEGECSETWFADILGFDSLIGHTVVLTEILPDTHPDDNRSREDEDIAYGIKITTNAGIADIIYRNSSNGYYCGSIERETKPVDLSEMVEIKDDWQAQMPVWKNTDTPKM